MNQYFRLLYQFQVVRWSGKRLRGYVLTRFQRLLTFAHGNVEQPACRDLEYIIDCQVDMMSGQMQVM